MTCILFYHCILKSLPYTLWNDIKSIIPFLKSIKETYTILLLFFSMCQFLIAFYNMFYYLYAKKDIFEELISILRCVIMNILWSIEGSTGEKTIRLVPKDQVKQVFAGVLFKKGIRGCAFRVTFGETKQEIIKSSITLTIDNKVIQEKTIQIAENKQEYYILLPNVKKVEKKVSVTLTVLEGTLCLPKSSLGTGMGFVKQGATFVPSGNFAFGIILED